MKKIAVLIMSFMLVASGFVLMLDMNVEGKEVVPAPLFTGEGSGTVADPYEITDIDQLQEMNDDLNANYTLMNDIDAKITSTWNIKSGFQPVGNNTAYFNGTLNGNGYAISNLTINRSAEDHVGLFGYLNQSASIDDLGLENGNITGHQYVGGLVGRNYGNVTNSYSTVNITGDNGVGGFAGRNEQGTITNCYSTGNATAGGGVGGFAGHNFGAGSTITDCYSTGNVVAGTGDATGGFIGFTNSGSITNCYSSGNVTGIGMVGGFVGADGGATTNCYSTGNADGSSDSVGGFAGLRGGGTTTNCYSTGNAVGTVKIGGFAGWSNSAIIKNCYSTGSASGTDYVGGFNGITDSFGNIENCYSTGSSTGTAGNIGGFIGANWQGVIMNSYSTGIATGTGADVDNIGGFVGQNNDGSISNSYSNGNAIGPDSDSAFVAGFAGRNAATIMNCHSTGSATTPGDAVGGFTGRNDAAGVITDSYSTGDADITGPGWEIGGFTGQNHGSIERCYSLGDATTAGGGIAGGFVGNNYNIITDCFARGNADASSDRAGGFAGYNSNGDTITSCYSIGTVSGGFEGGFAGENGVGSTISISHWDTTISGTGLGVNINSGTAGVAGHVTAVMKQQGTFSGWDFVNVWGIVQDNTYPFFTTIDPIIINEQITQIGMATEDTEYSFDFNSTVQPIPFYNEVENWTLDSDADWLSISPFTGILSGTPTNADVGTFRVNITATDTLGSEGNFNYTLIVENTGLTIIGTDTTTTNTGALYSVDYDSTDDPSTTWSLTGNATGWLSIDNDGILSGTPSNAEADIYNVEVTVDDGNGETDTQIFLLTVNLDTDGDGDPDETDLDDDNDGVPDTSDDFPLNPAEDTDTDGDGTGNNADIDDDWDGWNDTIEITGGFDPLDNTSMPSDADDDGIADFMDTDFLTNTVNVTVPVNVTVNVTIGVTDADSDSDGWNDSAELLAGTDPLDDTDMPSDSDDDGIADYMDSDNLAFETIVDNMVYNNNTEYNNNTIAGESETPIWAWGAVIAAAVMGVLAVIGFMRGGKPEPVEEVPEPEPEEPNIQKEEIE